ncbi:MAG: VWA domain-containing protein [Thermodesulfobacteriota bacterium]|nr:VWA domain-containing protein [Thermodesulfobacteriota bacterium]
MKKRRREIQVFSLSFLDVVSCGFGAIILLLVISRFSEPTVIEKISVDLSGQVMELEEQLHEIRGQTDILNRELTSKQEQLSTEEEKIARLQGELETIRGEFKAAQSDVTVQSRIEAQMESARQKLSREMKRLQQVSPPEKILNQTIGGVPVDSEYIIFVIDTSGSMQRYAWPQVRTKMDEILRIYPRVKGIQVLNDMGDYMFSQYAGRWIRDSPARRRAILKRLGSWAPFSNSSPVEGVTSAIRRFYSPDKRISIYIFGDDFARGSIQQVIDTVSSINRASADGRRRVRIHAVGFPVLFTQPGASANVTRFSALMRRLAEENNGSFVGLNSLR